MALIDPRTARVLITVLAFILVLGFLYLAHYTLVAFLFAVFFAYLVDPAVSRVEKWTKSRGWAIAAIYLLLLVLLITFFFFVGPQIAHQTETLTQSLPKLLENVSSGNIAKQIGHERGWDEATSTRVQEFLYNHRSTLLNIAQAVGIRVAQVARQAWLIIVVPILAAFFLKDGRGFSEVLLSFLHAKAQREFLQGVLDDLNQMLAQFIRAQLTLAACSFVAYMAFLGPMQVQYWLVLSSAGGAMEFIPVVGPLLAAAVIMAVALLTGQHWLMLLIFLAVWRLIQDYVVSPRIMGRSLELHPLGAIFGVLAGAEIAGVLGVYLSIPIMASLRIVWRRWRLYAEKRRFGPLNEYSFGSEISPRQ